MPIVCLSEAARQTGLHRQQLQRLLKSNRLSEHDRGHDASGHQLVELEGLRATALARTRPRIDSPRYRQPVATLQWDSGLERALDALNSEIDEAVEESGIEHPQLQPLIEAVAIAAMGFALGALVE